MEKKRRCKERVEAGETNINSHRGTQEEWIE